ncbi:MAG: site-specific integrase [Oligoflexales bacterium]|nr:site-specific integrase [Oligoflexales bacterium]
MKSRDGKVTHCRKTQYGTFKVRFYDESNKVRDRTCKTLTEAKALMRAIKFQEDLDYWYPEQNQESCKIKTGTFSALAENWLEHCKKVRDISESCLINYRGHLRNHILPVIADKLVKDLTLLDIEEIAKCIAAKKPQTRSYVAVRKNRFEDDFFEDDEFLSTAYRREILTVACMISKYGFERGFLSLNPFKDFKLPESAEQPYDYWSMNDEDAFLDWLEQGGPYLKHTSLPHSRGKKKYDKPMKLRNSEELFDIVLFALRSGLRKGEIGALSSRDVFLDKGFIMVRRAFSTKENKMKNTTKGKTFRRVEINADMIQILEKRMRRVSSDKDLLFNIKMNSIKFFSRTCRLAKVKEIHFHSLRHTCLTNLANGYGMDKPLPLPQVQRIAGHREISTTMRYVHAEGVENTTSQQWSREDRKRMAKEKDKPIEQTKASPQDNKQAQESVQTIASSDSSKEVGGYDFSSRDNGSGKVITIRRRLRLVSNEA